MLLYISLLLRLASDSHDNCTIMYGKNLNVHKMLKKPETFNTSGTHRTKCNLIEVPVAVELVRSAGNGLSAVSVGKVSGTVQVWSSMRIFARSSSVTSVTGISTQGRYLHCMWEPTVMIVRIHTTFVTRLSNSHTR